jgi:hypothetical protein
MAAGRSFSRRRRFTQHERRARGTLATARSAQGTGPRDRFARFARVAREPSPGPRERLGWAEAGWAVVHGNTRDR